MLGKHVFGAVYDCNKEYLDDPELLIKLLEEGATKAGATVVQTIHKHFTPQGVTVLTLLSESHISIHTWPEKGEAAIDIFTCGTKCDPMDGVLHIIKALDPASYSIESVDR